MTTITDAGRTIALVMAERMVIQELRHFNECVAIIWDDEEKTYEPMWMHIDFTDRYIKCTRGTIGEEKVAGFYPMTKAGIRQAYHDIRLCAWYSKS